MLDCLLDFFFFSSRRRHTRLVSDWSSDVCSSDLVRTVRKRDVEVAPARPFMQRPQAGAHLTNLPEPRPPAVVAEIGRASCRERGEMSGVAGALKKKREEVGNGGR